MLEKEPAIILVADHRGIGSSLEVTGDRVASLGFLEEQPRISFPTARIGVLAIASGRRCTVTIASMSVTSVRGSNSPGAGDTSVAHGGSAQQDVAGTGEARLRDFLNFDFWPRCK